jgi:hypothetical protein
MDSKTFINIMRKLISEEVRKVVREEVRKALNEQHADHRQIMQHGVNMYNEHKPINGKTSKNNIKFTKDTLLNDLLQETAATMSPNELYTEPRVKQDYWTLMGSRNFSSSDVHAIAARSTAKPSVKPAVAPTTDINGNPVNMKNDSVASAVNLMNRDYSALMKAIDKKKGMV